MIVPKAPREGPALLRKRLATGRQAQVAALLAVLAAGGAAAEEPGRFPLGERGPLNAVFGIPGGWTDLSGRRAELSWSIASHAVAEAIGNERYLLLDGETHTVTLRFQHALGRRLSLGLELPWIAHSGGFLDAAIDSWHDFFGLSEGIRPALPRNDLQFVYGQDGTERFRLDRRTSGLGDLHSAAVFRLIGSGDPRPPLRVDLTADVDWPTGDAARLTGNSGLDFAAGLRVGPTNASRLGWTLAAGLLWPGDLDLPLPAPSGRLFYYDLGLAWTAWPALDLLVQLNGHSGAYQSGLNTLGGDTLQVGAGLLWRAGRRHSLRFGIYEDLRSDTAPDFSVELALLVRALR